MHFDILTAREAALLLEIEFQRHDIVQSGWDALNDAQQGRKGTSTLPVAKKNGKRYYRREDVQEIARQIISRGSKPRSHARNWPSWCSPSDALTLTPSWCWNKKGRPERRPKN
ncbi:hypothetical protein ACFSQE_06405 [Vogesella fluminis]|uniref:hypothetical protein n=1 Tax=Vogesella fluminis TaxID=1069161 RepID=UPI003626352F